jgi:carbohydrate diacid regulator
MTDLKLSRPQTMTSLLTPFERVAEAITDRVAAVLSADVVVTDARGIVVSSNQRRLIGLFFDPNSVEQPESTYWVPLMIEGQIGKVITNQPPHGEILSSRLLKNLVELVSTQVKVDWQPNTTELRDTFFHDLMHGLYKDEETVLREAAVLSIDLNVPYQLLLIDAASYILGSNSYQHPETADSQVRRRAQTVISTVLNVVHTSHDTLGTYIGNGEIIFLRTYQNKPQLHKRHQSGQQTNTAWEQSTTLHQLSKFLIERLHSNLDPHISIGIGRHHPGLSGFSRSYEEARAAITLGRRFKNAAGLYSLGDLGIAAFIGLTDERTKAELAAYLLRPIIADQELHRTLTIFFTENCSPSATVKRLSIHRNTLSYRLDKITALSGFDPRKFDDAVQLRLALLLHSNKENVAASA